jgi:hypothetical protein
MAHLNGVVSHDTALDEQLQDRLLVLERRGLQSGADPLAVGGEVVENRVRVRPLLTQSLRLLPLLHPRLPPELQCVSPLAQFHQPDELRLVRIEEPTLLASHAIQPPLQALHGRLFLGISVHGCLCRLVELPQQTGGILEHVADLHPHRRLPLLRLDASSRTRLLARTGHVVFAVADVLAALRPARGGLVGDAQQCQPAVVARQPAAQPIGVLGSVPPPERATVRASCS